MFSVWATMRCNMQDPSVKVAVAKEYIRFWKTCMLKLPSYRKGSFIFVAIGLWMPSSLLSKIPVTLITAHTTDPHYQNQSCLFDTFTNPSATNRKNGRALHRTQRTDPSCRWPWLPCMGNFPEKHSKADLTPASGGFALVHAGTSIRNLYYKKGKAL